MKVLLIAEAANPEWVSVPLVGWSHVEAISRKIDSFLVTQVRNKDAILGAGYKEHIDFLAIDSEAVARPMSNLGSFLTGDKGSGWTTGMALSYFSYIYFEHVLWKEMKSRIKSGEFDIVHRITPLSPTLPSFIARKCRRYNIPFILGPLNGGLPWPKEFNRERTREKEWLSYIRSVYKILPGYRSTRRNSTAILVASCATMDQMEKKYLSKCHYIPENGIDLNRFNKIRTKKVQGVLKAIFIGRLVPYKGAHMLIRGFKKALLTDSVTIDIVGDGPDRERLEKLVEELGIEGKVFFRGWIEHTEVQDYLTKSDFLAFPSIREFGGGVVLEAMALGVMPMIVNYGGPSELATEETGILIDLGSEEEIVVQLEKSLDYLLENRRIIDEYGMRARERIMGKFTWDKKASEVVELYNTILIEKSNNKRGGKR